MSYNEKIDIKLLTINKDGAIYKKTGQCGHARIGLFFYIN